ncbi:unnamed protein product [Protopolystoma xenopodis]|uniref:Uncharacterized protein n=1 Tax=Protopolystoma xenopodis TaxID=117903 RepID=A0A448WAV2_9PLAT|nr:unnamed protein product [Protopolystoma xenopodis]
MGRTCRLKVSIPVRTGCMWTYLCLLDVGQRALGGPEKRGRESQPERGQRDLVMGKLVVTPACMYAHVFACCPGDGVADACVPNACDPLHHLVCLPQPTPSSYALPSLHFQFDFPLPTAFTPPTLATHLLDPMVRLRTWRSEDTMGKQVGQADD